MVGEKGFGYSLLAKGEDGRLMFERTILQNKDYRPVIQGTGLQVGSHLVLVPDSPLFYWLCVRDSSNALYADFSVVVDDGFCIDSLPGCHHIPKELKRTKL